MLSSALRFQTTASGIRQDSRSYDNNMSSNTTSSSFVSDDEVRYFKQTKVQCRFSNLPGEVTRVAIRPALGGLSGFSKPCPASGAASSRFYLAGRVFVLLFETLPSAVGPGCVTIARAFGLTRSAFCPSRQFIVLYRPEGHGSLHRAYLSYVNSDK